MTVYITSLFNLIGFPGSGFKESESAAFAASRIFSQIYKVYITCLCPFDPNRASYLFFDDLDCARPSPAVCFFLLGAPSVAVSTNGPDQVWIDGFEYEKCVELNGTSEVSKTGSI